ncbi:MAG: glycosyltransferase family 39 protein, partial [Saprospiraceae bacterium]|nr:glycosyltransferase family 39 protein [Saprospiraceae bacterium]
LFAGLGAVFFLPFLGGVHLFDWDEINFAEIAREMIVLDEYLRIYVDFQPFWEKPPLFFWMQAVSMHVFGIGEYAARFPNAICGMLTLVLLFQIGNRLYNWRFGVIWAGIYLGTILPHLYFKSGLIDPFFNLFIFGGIYYFILFYWKKERYEGISLLWNKWTYLFLAGLITGMGILTKGPVAYLIIGLTLFVYWVYQRFRFYVSVPQFIFFTFSATLVTLAWYGVETWKHGSWFITEFTKYQYRLFSTPDAGHAGFPGYHFVVLLVGCFPASLLAIRGFFPTQQSARYQQNFKVWMSMLFWVVLILFSIVQSKIVHYSSMCYFPLTYLAALVADQILDGKIPLNKWIKGGILGIGSLYVLASLAMPVLGKNPQWIAPLLAGDPFALENLKALVSWTGWEVLPGVFLAIALILSIYWMNHNQPKRGFFALFGGTAVYVMLALVFFIGRIERYSQGAAIRFFERQQQKDAYVITWGYKSYGQLFYSRKVPPIDVDLVGKLSPDAQPSSVTGFQSLDQFLSPPVPYFTPAKSYDQNWLLNRAVDKEVYVITKIQKADELQKKAPELVELDRENGFVFFKRPYP